MTEELSKDLTYKKGKYKKVKMIQPKESWQNVKIHIKTLLNYWF